MAAGQCVQCAAVSGSALWTMRAVAVYLIRLDSSLVKNLRLLFVSGRVSRIGSPQSQSAQSSCDDVSLRRRLS